MSFGYSVIASTQLFVVRPLSESCSQFDSLPLTSLTIPSYRPLFFSAYRGDRTAYFTNLPNLVGSNAVPYGSGVIVTSHGEVSTFLKSGMPRRYLVNGATPASQCFAASLPMFLDRGGARHGAVLRAVADVFDGEARGSVLPALVGGYAAYKTRAAQLDAQHVPLSFREPLLDIPLVVEVARNAWHRVLGVDAAAETVHTLVVMAHYKFACGVLDASAERLGVLLDVLPDVRVIRRMKMSYRSVVAFFRLLPGSFVAHLLYCLLIYSLPYSAARARLVAAADALPSVAKAASAHGVADLGAVLVDTVSWFAFGATLDLAAGALHALRVDVASRLKWWQLDADAFLIEVARLHVPGMTSFGVTLAAAQNLTIATATKGIGSRTVTLEAHTPIQLALATANRDTSVWGGAANSVQRAARFDPIGRFYGGADGEHGARAASARRRVRALPTSFTAWSLRASRDIARQLIVREVALIDADCDGIVDDNNAARAAAVRAATFSERLSKLRRDVRRNAETVHASCAATWESCAAPWESSFTPIVNAARAYVPLELIGFLSEDGYWNYAAPLLTLLVCGWNVLATFGCCRTRVPCITPKRHRRLAAVGRDQLTSWFGYAVYAAIGQQLALLVLPPLYSAASLSLDDPTAAYYVLGFVQAPIAGVVALLFSKVRCSLLCVLRLLFFCLLLPGSSVCSSLSFVCSSRSTRASPAEPTRAHPSCAAARSRGYPTAPFRWRSSAPSRSPSSPRCSRSPARRGAAARRSTRRAPLPSRTAPRSLRCSAWESSCTVAQRCAASTQRAPQARACTQRCAASAL